MKHTVEELRQRLSSFDLGTLPLPVFVTTGEPTGNWCLVSQEWGGEKTEIPLELVKREIEEHAESVIEATVQDIGEIIERLSDTAGGRLRAQHSIKLARSMLWSRVGKEGFSPVSNFIWWLLDKCAENVWPEGVSRVEVTERYGHRLDIWGPGGRGRGRFAHDIAGEITGPEGALFPSLELPTFDLPRQNKNGTLPLSPYVLGWLYVAEMAPEQSAIEYLRKIDYQEKIAPGLLFETIEKVAAKIITHPVWPKTFVEMMAPDAPGERVQAISESLPPKVPKPELGEIDPKWLDLRTLTDWLAPDLWESETCSEVARRKNLIVPPGMTVAAFTQLRPSLTRKSAQTRIDGGIDFVNKQGRITGKIDLDDGGPMVALGIVASALTTMQAQGVLRHLLHAGYHQTKVLCLPETSRNTLIYDGGFTSLASQVNGGSIRSGTDITDTRNAILALSSLVIDLPGGWGHILSFWEDKAGPGKRAKLTVTLQGPMRSDYAQELRLKRNKHPGRGIIPVPVPKLLPEMVGRANEHSAQGLLQLTVLEYLTVNAEEYYEQGEVVITDKAWNEMFDQVELPKKLKPKILDAYATPSQAQPFLLRRGDAYHLAPEPYLVEDRAIKNLGKMAANGRRGINPHKKGRKKNRS